MDPIPAAPHRPYSWGQYVKTLFLLIGFGWLVVFILMSITELQRSYSLVLRDPLHWISMLLFFGIPIAALTAVVFLSLPLWWLMRRPILPARAILAGFVVSTCLIVAFSILMEEIPSTEQLIWRALFIQLCTLSAWIIQRIIGPGEPPKDIAKVFD